MANNDDEDWGLSWMARKGLGVRDLDREYDRGESNERRERVDDRERDLENLLKRLGRRGLMDEDGR